MIEPQRIFFKLHSINNDQPFNWTIMLATNYRGPKGIGVDNFTAIPEIQHPQNAIIKVTQSCICSSDLHLSNGNVAEKTADTFWGMNLLE